jgi:hypothetical protein
MTSRQPGTTPPGTTGLVGTPDGTGTAGNTPGEGGGHAEGGRAEGGRAEGGHGAPALTAQDWLLRLLPLTLLIIAGLAGLRGAVGALRWNGPLHQDVLVVGVVLEVVILTMLVILLIRRRSGSQEATAVKLRGVLLSVLGAGGVAAAVLMVAGLHLHVFSQRARPRPIRVRVPTPAGSIRPRLGPGAAPHISLTVLLYALLVAVLLAGSRSAPGWPGGCGRRPRSGPATTTSSQRTRNSCAKRWSRAGRRCAPSTTRGPPSSRATWPWRLT